MRPEERRARVWRANLICIKAGCRLLAQGSEAGFSYDIVDMRGHTIFRDVDLAAFLKINDPSCTDDHPSIVRLLRAGLKAYALAIWVKARTIAVR